MANGRKPALVQYLSFAMIFYAIIVAFLYFGYGFSQEHLMPLGGLIFPINPNNSPMKSILISSVFYWIAIAAVWFLSKNKPAA